MPKRTSVLANGKVYIVNESSKETLIQLREYFKKSIASIGDQKKSRSRNGLLTDEWQSRAAIALEQIQRKIVKVTERIEELELREVKLGEYCEVDELSAIFMEVAERELPPSIFAEIKTFAEAEAQSLRRELEMI